jgi:ParB family transcriptional regulator, chromosome partitioning protein
MEKRKVLGRGLDTLLPSRHAPATAPATPAPLAGEAIHQLAIELIDRNPYQTRTHVDEPALRELADSINASGVLQPITVRAIPDGRYQLITGERRWLASKRAGKSTVPSIVRQVSNEQAMEMTIVENLQREDLNSVEQARAFDRLSREFGLTQEQMAQRTGKDRSSIANYLRLLRLPERVQNLVESNQISFGHAKALMGLDSPAAMVSMANRVVDRLMSVRQTEDAVTDYLHPLQRKEMENKIKALMVDPNVKEAERQIERSLGVKVTITDRKGKGKILLEYSSLEDFDRILSALAQK